MNIPKMTDNDLFNNPMVQAMEANMSPAEKEKYKQLGEKLYNNIDFVQGVCLEKPPIEEAAAFICSQLRSGIHPSLLENNEKQIMSETFGPEWYKQWGYVDQDLNEIFTLKF
jgi:hypothetical protein